MAVPRGARSAAASARAMTARSRASSAAAAELTVL
jgi:hypothetical protein